MKQISLHLELNVVKKKKKTAKNNIVMLDVSCRSLPATGNLSGGGGSRGESWFHSFVLRKAFTNSSAFRRGGGEWRRPIAFGFADAAVFFL